MTERPRFGAPENWQRPAAFPPIPVADGTPTFGDFVPEDGPGQSVADRTSVTPAVGEVASLPEQEPEREHLPPAPPGPGERPTTREKGERVELQGYVAGNPWFGNDRRGVPTCVFPLATHPEPDRTVTWRIRAKRERAEKLRGTLTKGDAVAVVGYLHRDVVERGGRAVPSEIVNLVSLRNTRGNTRNG